MRNKTKLKKRGRIEETKLFYLQTNMRKEREEEEMSHKRVYLYML